MKKISFKAILLGWVTAIMLLFFLFILFAVTDHYNKTSFHSSLVEQYSTIVYYLLSIVIFIVAGYLAAKFSQKKHLFHSFLSGQLFLFVLLLYTIISYLDGLYHRWEEVLLVFLLILILFLLGGYLAKILQVKTDSSLSKEEQEKRIKDFGKISEKEN